MHAAMWMVGAFAPMDSPDPTDKTRPSIFMAAVCSDRTRRMLKPPSIVFSSGIPLSAAYGGAYVTTKAEAEAAKNVAIIT